MNNIFYENIVTAIVLELQWIYSTVEFQSSYYSAIQCATDLKLYYVIAYEKVDNIFEKNALTLILLKIFDIYLCHDFATNNKIENFNYLNVAFISYKLTMWDLMLFSGCHTRGQRLRKKDRSC